MWMWTEQEIFSWVMRVLMDSNTLRAYGRGFRAFVVWFTEDGEIIVKYYSTLRNARIAAKTRYRKNPYYKISTFRVEQIIL